MLDERAIDGLLRDWSIVASADGANYDALEWMRTFLDAVAVGSCGIATGLCVLGVGCDVTDLYERGAEGLNDLR